MRARISIGIGLPTLAALGLLAVVSACEPKNSELLGKIVEGNEAQATKAAEMTDRQALDQLTKTVNGMALVLVQVDGKLGPSAKMTHEAAPSNAALMMGTWSCRLLTGGWGSEGTITAESGTDPATGGNFLKLSDLGGAWWETVNFFDQPLGENKAEFTARLMVKPGEYSPRLKCWQLK